jgi:hypothetical protein
MSIPALFIASIIRTLDTIPVAYAALQIALQPEYIKQRYEPTAFSAAPEFSDMYFVSDFISGRPMLAVRAVLLGIAGATRNSVIIMLYESPSIFLPKHRINKYAILIPIGVPAITFDKATTENSNQGTEFENPENDCCTSNVPLKLPIKTPMKSANTGSHTPAIMLDIAAMNMMIM